MRIEGLGARVITSTFVTMPSEQEAAEGFLTGSPLVQSSRVSPSLSPSPQPAESLAKDNSARLVTNLHAFPILFPYSPAFRFKFLGLSLGILLPLCRGDFVGESRREIAFKPCVEARIILMFECGAFRRQTLGHLM